MIPWVEPDERTGHFRFIHACTGGMKRISVLPIGEEGWQWDQEADTVTPSIHCLGCETHGFWREGKWVPA